MTKWILAGFLSAASLILFACGAPDGARLDSGPETRAQGASDVAAAMSAAGPDAAAAPYTGRGFTYTVDVDGARAVFGRGREIVLADVTDPSAPVELLAVRLPGTVRDVVMHGERAFAAADTAGLQIVDLETGAIAGSLRFRDRAYGVAVDGDHVYVAARSEGLRVVDASAAPREIGHLVTADEAVNVVLQGDLAYVAAWYESMRIVDVSEPTEPVELGFASYDSYDHGAVWSVAVDGNLGLLLIPEKGFRAVDVSDPANVRIHSRYRPLRAPTAADLSGPLAFVADQDAGLRVFDLQDPAAPVEMAALDLPGRVMDVAVSEGIAFVAAKEAGLRLVDVSVPHAPREIGFLDPDDEIVDVVADGGALLAVGAENGVYRHDGRLVRSLDARGRRVIIHQNLVITAGRDGLQVHDEGHAVAEVPGETYGIAAHGDLLAAAGPPGIRFFALDRSLSHVGTYVPDDLQAEVGDLRRGPPAAWDVVLSDGRAYAAFDDGVHVIGLADSRSEAGFTPSLLGRLATPERVYRLVRTGETLAAACDDGLRLIDVSDPAHPRERAYVKTPSFATALVVDGDAVYVGDLSGHVTMVSLDDGRPLASWRAAERVYGLARTTSGLAVAAGAEGLRMTSN